MFKDEFEVAFSQALGRYVETRLAPALLRRLYDPLEYLGATFPWADYYGYRYGQGWLISVKGRFVWDRHESARRGCLVRNPRYKLDGDRGQAVMLRPGKLAWLTVPMNFDGTYEAFHGTVEELSRLGVKESGVPMSDAAIARNGYTLICRGAHSFPFHEHPHVWAYDLFREWRAGAR